MAQPEEMREMMEPLVEGTQVPRRKARSGQTLAEFALTLPILLLLIFGIIEFGRIFQAWVTLQNAARAAARYATTGQYNEERYQLQLEYFPASPSDLNSIVPCIALGDATYPTVELQRGTRSTYYPNSGGPEDAIEIYTGGPESLYATWWGGDDCQPEDSEDQNRRKDMARILSIYDEARRGAAGLGLGTNPWPAPILGAAAGNDPTLVPWYRPWFRLVPGDVNSPIAGSNVTGWFDMMICSARAKLQDANDPSPNTIARRFEEDIEGPDPRAPICILQEQPQPVSGLRDAGWTLNQGRPWLDAGGPGDTIWIVVTFNHPLITPMPSWQKPL